MPVQRLRRVSGAWLPAPAAPGGGGGGGGGGGNPPPSPGQVVNGPWAGGWSLAVGKPAPSSSNTGAVAPAGGFTTVSGNLTATSNGQTFTNLDISGSFFTGNYDNITMTNCRAASININMAAGGNYFYPVHQGFTFRRCTAKYVDSTGGLDITLDGCEIGNANGTWMAFASYSDTGGAGGATRLFPCDRVIIVNTLAHNALAQPAGSAHLEALHFLGVPNVWMQNSVFSYIPPDGATASQMTGVINSGGGEYGYVNDHHTWVDTTWQGGGALYAVYSHAKNLFMVRCNWLSPIGTPLYPPSAYPSSDPWVPAYYENNTRDGVPYTPPNS